MVQDATIYVVLQFGDFGTIVFVAFPDDPDGVCDT